jgi:hypothetical protein
VACLPPFGYYQGFYLKAASLIQMVIEIVSIRDIELSCEQTIAIIPSAGNSYLALA